MIFKLIVEISGGAFNDFYMRLSEIGDILFIQDVFYIDLKDGFNKKSLLSLLKHCEFKNFYIQELTPDDVRGSLSMENSWLMQHFDKHIAKDIEKNNQDKLKTMLDNIEKANELLNNNAQLKKKNDTEGR